MAEATIQIMESGAGGLEAPLSSIYAESHQSPTGNALISNGIGQYYYNGLWHIRRLPLCFDCRQTAPQRVLAARMKVFFYKGTESPVPSVDYILQSGANQYPHYPIIPEDFDLMHYQGTGAIIHDSDVPINQAGLPFYLDIMPDALSWIQLGRWTTFIFRSSDDILGNPVSNLNGFSVLYSGFGGSITPPVLEVTYEVGAPPEPPTWEQPAAECPPFPWWWILIAAAAGLTVGYQARKQQEKKTKSR